MKVTSLALSLGAVTASSEVSMMKSPEGLRKLGLERHAEMAEFGKGFYPLAIRIDRLENILKDALLGAAPRPVDEADDFSKCGCASPSDTRNDAMELPAGQKDGKFAKTEGVVGLRCLRKEVRVLPPHDEERCGPLCYPIKVELMDPAVHASYATLCPAPLVADCSWQASGAVSECAYPFTSEMPLKERTNLLEIGVKSYEQAYNWQQTETVKSSTTGELSAVLDVIETTLLSTLTAEVMPRPTAAKLAQCGCKEGIGLAAATHIVRVSDESKAQPLGWLCEHTGPNYNAEICGPLCKVPKDSKGAFPDKAIIHFCPAGMDAQCTGCTAPAVSENLAAAKDEL